MHPLVSGPILRTLLGLTWPNLVAMGTLMIVSIVETGIVGRLGLSSLAAMSLVFPTITLMQMLAGGSIGGAVASLVSRELGRGRPDQANTVAFHGLIVAVVLGTLFLIGFLLAGQALYTWLGGRDEVLAIALRYAGTVFAVLPLMWAWMVLAGILRSAGDMRLPARIMVASAVTQMALGLALGFGIGPLPAMWMVGVGLGQAVPSVLAAIFGLWYVGGGRATVRLTVGGRLPRLQPAIFADILKLGGISCLQPLQSMLIVMIVGRLVAPHGVEALAAYGIGARLEILLMNIVWAVGVASVPMVGMAIGAGQAPRARRVGWTAASVAATFMLTVGGGLALMPDLWLGLFTSDPDTLATGRQYLQRVGPCLIFLGAGSSLYFSSQGAGRVVGPVFASTTRLAVIVAGGWWVSSQGAGVDTVFALIGAAMIVYGVIAALAVRFTDWTVRVAPVPAPKTA